MADQRPRVTDLKSQEELSTMLTMQDNLQRMQLTAQTPAGDSLPSTTNTRKTADDWKQEGNAEFGKGRYFEAITSYTAALCQDPTTTEELTIRNNRVLTYLKDGQLDEAICEGLKLSSIPQTEEKALFRTGQAFYALGKFSESLAMFSELCQKYPNHAQATAGVKRAKARLEEQQKGKYDFLEINKEAAKLRPPQLDHATFIGPVTVKNSPGRGRGLFTTKAVKAGDLILCEKAFAHSHKEEDTSHSNGPEIFRTIRKQEIINSTQTDLVMKLVQKVSKNPSVHSQFTELFHGSFDVTATKDVDSKLSIDPRLVKEIIRFNAFGGDLISREVHIGITATNKTKHHCRGVWLKASTINHSCFANVRRAFIGDLLIVRASRDVPADTELTFTYNRPNGDGDDMQTGLVNWGFQCECAICIDWKETSPEAKMERKKLLTDLQTSLSKSNFNAAAAETVLTSIQKTYKQPATEVPRFVLCDPYFRLACHYLDMRDGPKVVSASLKFLESLGFVIKNGALGGSPRNVFRVEKWGVMVDDVVKAFVLLWNTYYGFQQEQNLAVVADYGRIAYMICVGEDETHTQSYGDNSS